MKPNSVVSLWDYNLVRDYKNEIEKEHTLYFVGFDRNYKIVSTEEALKIAHKTNEDLVAENNKLKGEIAALKSKIK